MEKANFLETQEKKESKEKSSICFLQVHFEAPPSPRPLLRQCFEKAPWQMGIR